MVIAGPILTYGAFSLLIFSFGIFLIHKKLQNKQVTLRIVSTVLWSTGVLDVLVLSMFFKHILLSVDIKAVLFLM